MDVKNFKNLGLNTWILRRLDELSIKLPTPIQMNCIIPILKGNDCIGAAKTGSGKTLAFALPILQKLSEEPYGIFALVLTPTRELAYQIKDTFYLIGKAINVRVSVIVGGISMTDQATELAKQPHVIISTPGRLKDHLDSGATFSLKRVKFFVLDEADRLLCGPFDEQIEVICKALPKKKQTLCFSATITDTLQCLRNITADNVFQWEQTSDVATVDELKQYYVLCPGYVKDGYLVQVIKDFLEENEYASIIVFTDTCLNCQLLSVTLNEISMTNVPLHSMISQKERLASLQKFKANQVKLLVATDVASRGLDIPLVELVINYNIPLDSKNYIHRVGRTARAGKAGIAISLVTPSDIKLIHAVEQEINTKLKEYTVDSNEVAKIFTQVSVTKRSVGIKLDQEDFFEKKAIYKRKNLILEGKDPDDTSHGSTFDVNNYNIIKRKKKKKKGMLLK